MQKVFMVGVLKAVEMLSDKYELDQVNWEYKYMNSSPWLKPKTLSVKYGTYILRSETAL